MERGTALLFESPAQYHITITGGYAPSVIDAQIPINYEVVHYEARKVTLELEVKDQAELIAVINAIYNSRHSLLEVKTITAGKCCM